VFINIVLRMSYVSDAKSATNAFWVFLGFYVVCAIVTWFVFLRMGAAGRTAKDDRLPEQAVTA
jgi:NNP family nitrate/nitrite transporter-like MFS transporter